MAQPRSDADGCPELGQLLWRCRRGMKELDVLLEGFARTRLAAAGGAERSTFARFLDLPDPLIAEYLLGTPVAPEPEFARLAALIARRPAHP